MSRVITLLYGTLAYASFFGAILYMIGFLGGFGVPKDINSGETGSLSTAMAVNLALVLAFGVQHTIMARPAFKRWWTQYMPEPMERSTFVLASSAVLALTFWLWQPMPGSAWLIEGTPGKIAMYSLFGLGWFLVFYSSFLINHFDLFGLRQVFLYFRKKSYTPVPMKVVSLYKFVRNPLMLGFLLAMWATPHMTASHLLFAVSMTAYIGVGIWFEERTLEKELGETYRAYRKRTPMIIPAVHIVAPAAHAPVDIAPVTEGK